MEDIKFQLRFLKMMIRQNKKPKTPFPKPEKRGFQ